MFEKHALACMLMAVEGGAATVTGSDWRGVPASSESISMTMPQMDTPRFAISAATLNPGWVRWTAPPPTCPWH